MTRMRSSWSSVRGMRWKLNRPLPCLAFLPDNGPRNPRLRPLLPPHRSLRHIFWYRSRRPPPSPLPLPRFGPQHLPGTKQRHGFCGISTNGADCIKLLTTKGHGFDCACRDLLKAEGGISLVGEGFDSFSLETPHGNASAPVETISQNIADPTGW